MRFGSYVRERLERIGLSAHEFAKALGKSPGNVSNILNRSQVNKSGAIARPPLEEMERWAVVLRLDASEVPQFIKLAELEHCPEGIRRRLLAYEATKLDPIDTNSIGLIEDLEELRSKIKRLEAENAQLRGAAEAFAEASKRAITPIRKLPFDDENLSPAQRHKAARVPFTPDPASALADDIAAIDRMTRTHEQQAHDEATHEEAVTPAGRPRTDPG